MAAKPISQREARALRRRVKELEKRERDLRAAYGSDFPGQWVTSLQVSDTHHAVLRTSARLGFVVVARLTDSHTERTLHFFAVPTEVRRAR